MMNLKKLACISLATAALAFGMSPARANFTLFFEDGVNYATIYDNVFVDDLSGAPDPIYFADGNTNPGTISWSGDFYSWHIDVTGLDLSTPGVQGMVTLSATVTNSSTEQEGSTLNFYLDLDGLIVPPNAFAPGVTTVSGTMAGTVNFISFVDAIPLASLTAFGSANGTGDTTNAILLTNAASITHFADNQTTQFDMITTIPVPEPVSLGLLGLGLLGLGFARRRIAA